MLLTSISLFASSILQPLLQILAPLCVNVIGPLKWWRARKSSCSVFNTRQQESWPLKGDRVMETWEMCQTVLLTFSCSPCAVCQYNLPNATKQNALHPRCETWALLIMLLSLHRTALYTVLLARHPFTHTILNHRHLFTYKTLLHVTLPYLSNLLHQSHFTCNLISANFITLVIPKASTINWGNGGGRGGCLICQGWLTLRSESPECITSRHPLPESIKDKG